MTKLSPVAVLVAVLAVAAVLLAPAPASACPSCFHHEQWLGTPCLTTNCSPCAFCAYCCNRWGIGCEYCYFEPIEGGTMSVAAASDDCPTAQEWAPPAADSLDQALADVLAGPAADE